MGEAEIGLGRALVDVHHGGRRLVLRRGGVENGRRFLISLIASQFHSWQLQNSRSLCDDTCQQCLQIKGRMPHDEAGRDGRHAPDERLCLGSLGSGWQARRSVYVYASAHLVWARMASLIK